MKFPPKGVFVLDLPAAFYIRKWYVHLWFIWLQFGFWKGSSILTTYPNKEIIKKILLKNNGFKN